MTSQDLQEALGRRLLCRVTASGEIRLPAVPSMLNNYADLCFDTFKSLGVVFDVEQSLRLRDVLAGQLSLAFDASPRSEIVISYSKPVGKALDYHVKAQWVTLETAYGAWVSTRKPPLFGPSPDARVWSLALQTTDPAVCPVLDLGAGTGRNALALARRGHPVDAIEMTAAFAGLLRRDAEGEQLGVRVLEGDLLARRDDLRRDYGLVVVSEVASDFRGADQLHQLFELAALSLAPGGHLVFNVFLPQVGYTPDAATRELGQQVYTSVFSYPEVSAAAAGLPLVCIADDPVLEFEQQHLPLGGWPPTSWYSDWVSGLDVFDLPREQSPIAMRWLVYKKEEQ
jgi:SAM-dependent methyltransferase